MNIFVRAFTEGLNRPLLVSPGYAATRSRGELMQFGLLPDLHALSQVDFTTAASEDFQRMRREQLASGYPGGSNFAQTKPFAFADGTAIIPIHGSLINRMPYSFSFATGYNFISSQVEAANADPDVTSIVFDVNSYGGMAAGCPECAADIAASEKPTMAVIDSNCYSAAYYLASATDKIVSTPSGGAGSIGVLMMHVDLSKALQEMGVNITFIHAGEHKVDGNPFEPLSAEVTSYLQGEIDKIYETFVGDVAANRSGLSVEAIKATGARIYQANDALQVGLIDSIQKPSDALSSLLNSDDPGDDQMAGQQNGDKAPATTQADVDKASADARSAERARVSGILNHAEAEGRTALANHLAMETDMDVEAAGKILKASPKDAKAAPAAPAEPAEPKQETNHFKNAMDNGKHPNVGGENGGGEGEGDPGNPKANRILAASRKASGYRLPNAAK